MPDNHAAYLVAKQKKPVEVRSAPYPSPGPGQVLIRARAVATNPIDFIKQTLGDILFGHLKYPIILGSDVAGEVVEVGSGVTRFKVGDRVVGHALGVDPAVNDYAESAFQEYAVLRKDLTSEIPNDMPFERAAVIPLGLSTAATALFCKDQLGLQLPGSKPTGETILVWGGATAVGVSAIQLAKSAGYRVVTTASPKNHDLMKSLGASQAFDYRSPTVVNDIITALKNERCAGGMAIAPGSTDPTISIVGGSPASSSKRKWVALCSGPSMPSEPPSLLGWISFIASFLWSGGSSFVKARLSGVSTGFVFGTDLMKTDLGKTIWEGYLPTALKEGTYNTALEPIVVGHGLEYIQTALDLHQKGVSASKPVVTV